MSDEGPGPVGTEDLLVPGETCWRIERADRHAVFVDAADYFATLKQAVLRAERRVLFIGWDFDPRIRLDPRAGGRRRPDTLGRVLEAAVKANPRLEIGVLQWDYGMVLALGRGLVPIVLLDRRTPDRLTMTVDAHHPVGGAHHEKIVVIDDCLAFVGGIDVTADRWDTSEHLDRHPHRRRPSSRRPTGPWHDVTSLVSGPAARALGDLARARWESGTGRRLEPVTDVETCWPAEVEPLFADVDVAISRTRPEHGGTSLVHEVELLWLAAIAAARRTVYIESQYFANRRIAEAIAERLKEPDGPEFVVVNPESADGWLEEEAMGTARARLLALVREADAHDRFRLYVPVTAGRRPVYVHAKVLVVDDRLLRVGSANLNNRSMGLDTECDLSIEARPGDPRREELAATITGLRDRLLGEHLGVQPKAVAAALIAERGSLVRAVESLRRPQGRSLEPFTPPDLGPLGRLLADTELLDAERTPNRWQRIRRSFRPRVRRTR
ncbi:phospholipase D-like domain-containing protein [Geodermatophilus ruber]|uniref:Phosphatidylserine/phosphatidylglycerophosphate/cardiolipin synthase n=1 Tax=Geodermatophilus ruber TaxID=504800 RepID=A0A1I4KQM0_9ACTN|nr:phospholipase D-like domain-containing protein [Geodermatophilus ruber]SFL81035.1 Phosphatidylserine/phosphatidylglycerophosphate/cardiolipin synthase [Geodermatophilus ruber]